MGILSGLIGMPLAPLRGTVWVAEQIRDEADKQFHDPAAIRRQLEQIADARRAGTIDEDEADSAERELVARLIRSDRNEGA
ncbi:gas vesicle protein GvpG [Brachybacterium sp. FME24]|uniref:gas vesicle protein GvpG n=1 Tax=Brachybacterium sp. FME24 TaxID=2742605 RepID=UPI001867D4FC|nr:gas vesicle protein GvpG [Brachybacterium sp. FME24]